PTPDFPHLSAESRERFLMSNSGKPTAIITGAGTGIGQATAKALAKDGFAVALLGRRADVLEVTAAEILADGGKAVVVPCDVACRDSVADAVKVLESQFDRFDVLVCNAGTNLPRRGLSELTPEDWDTLIDVNLTGAFNIVRAILPHMRKAKRGTVVQICSISGLRASTLGGIGYSAAKFGQSALGICLGREERENGIRSTVIYPGEVNTPILEQRPQPVPDHRRPLILQPEDVAAAVRFVVSLPDRANILELLIKPTVDDYA
ncbi:MAG: SDR family oxidoreductase, partial [bacterium]